MSESVEPFRTLEEASERTRMVADFRYEKRGEMFNPELVYFRGGGMMCFGSDQERIFDPTDHEQFHLGRILAEAYGAEQFALIHCLTSPATDDLPELELIGTLVGDRMGRRILTFRTATGEDHPMCGVHDFNVYQSREIVLPKGRIIYVNEMDPWLDDHQTIQ